PKITQQTMNEACEYLPNVQFVATSDFMV
ncbi:unnamed protein product, partial [Rotaria sp. Silwood2]